MDTANRQLQRNGSSVLHSAETTLRQMVEGSHIAVSSQLHHGGVVQALIADSADAELVVLQHHGMGVDGTPPVLCVTTAVAARAHLPGGGGPPRLAS